MTFEPRAYAASAITLLYLVKELPAACRSARPIGHNPGVSELASNLLEAAGDSVSGEGVPGSPGLRFPTAAWPSWSSTATGPGWPWPRPVSSPIPPPARSSGVVARPGMTGAGGRVSTGVDDL